ncbi:MAG: thioredoxin family protein [Psychroflexus sp.]|nr:thioredoxin family protein [Psychroflexus sp.]MDR9448113.1 thioredoxin family protein [Psychroflexus sp.]
MKTLLIMIIFLCSLSFYAQTDDFIGEVNLKSLMSTEQTDWFNKNYKAYTANEKKVERIKYLLEKSNYSFQIFFGAWCSDSKRDIPKMLKILNLAKVPQADYELIGVNEFKDLPKDYQNKADQIQLNRVPTLIVYKDGKPLNRIVEFPRVSVIDDLMTILEGKEYKHSYYGK